MSAPTHSSAPSTDELVALCQEAATDPAWSHSRQERLLSAADRLKTQAAEIAQLKGELAEAQREMFAAMNRAEAAVASEATPLAEVQRMRRIPDGLQDAVRSSLAAGTPGLAIGIRDAVARSIWLNVRAALSGHVTTANTSEERVRSGAESEHEALTPTDVSAGGQP